MDNTITDELTNARYAFHQVVKARIAEALGVKMILPVDTGNAQLYYDRAMANFDQIVASGNAEVNGQEMELGYNG